MGYRKVIWLRCSQTFVEENLIWYEENVSKKAAERFFNGLTVNARRVSINPSIGKVEVNYRRSGFVVRSVWIDKHYRMYYRYNRAEVVILAVWDMNGVKHR